jgi:hypothetical protein
MSLKRKAKIIEINDDAYIVKEPTGSQLQDIFEMQEQGERINSAYLCLKFSLHHTDGTPVFGEDDTVEEMIVDDISPSVATQVTKVTMELVTPKKQ